MKDRYFLVIFLFLLHVYVNLWKFFVGIVGKSVMNFMCSKMLHLCLSLFCISMVRPENVCLILNV